MNRVGAAVLTTAVLFFAVAELSSGAAKASTLSNVYSFTGGADGGELAGGVVQDASGTLYGETEDGGNLNCYVKGLDLKGCGTVFSYSAAAGLKVLSTFTGPNGKIGDSTLTLVGSTLFGSTGYGGAPNQGVIFSINTDGSNGKVLHEFHGSDGMGPVYGSMVAGPGNYLYGVTENGGAYSHGALFALSPSGSYHVLHSFTGDADGAAPLSLLLGSSTTLVGSTFNGGTLTADCSYGAGVAFTYIPAIKQFKVITDLTCGSTGPHVIFGSVGPNNLAYAIGGDDYYTVNILTGAVTIIPAVASGGESVGSDAESGPVLMPDGSLVGTFSQGPYASDGALYQVANGVVSDLWDFQEPVPGGEFPYAKPLLTPSGVLYGTSASGSCTNCGVIWQYTP